MKHILQIFPLKNTQKLNVPYIQSNMVCIIYIYIYPIQVNMMLIHFGFKHKKCYYQKILTSKILNLHMSSELEGIWKGAVMTWDII
jgi:hypothetical protein